MKTKTTIQALTLILTIMTTSCQCKKEADLPKQPTALETIFARKSVRNYTDQTIEQDKINTLLRAGMAAPSGKDKRPWEFVVVTDKIAMDSMAAALPYAKMLQSAQAAIVVCGDTTKSSYWYLDCSAATQNILLAAEALGLGAVWTAAYPYEERMNIVKQTVGLPENILPLCVIPIGYPAKEQQPKNKYDSTRIHINKY